MFISFCIFVALDVCYIFLSLVLLLSVSCSVCPKEGGCVITTRPKKACGRYDEAGWGRVSVTAFCMRSVCVWMCWWKDIVCVCVCVCVCVHSFQLCFVPVEFLHNFSFCCGAVSKDTRTHTHTHKCIFSLYSDLFSLCRVLFVVLTDAKTTPTHRWCLTSWSVPVCVNVSTNHSLITFNQQK